MKKTIETEYSLGQVVKHKYLDFRGVIYDVDPEFNNTEEWYQSIPAAIRPKKDQPFIMFSLKMTKFFIQHTYRNKIFLLTIVESQLNILMFLYFSVGLMENLTRY